MISAWRGAVALTVLIASLASAAVVIVESSSPQQVSSWIGVPAPTSTLPGGLQTSLTAIQAPTPNSVAGFPYDPLTRVGTVPANWPSAESPGDYYFDPSHPDSTNTSNPWGYPDQPRNSPPSDVLTLAAGSYVQFGGGTVSGAEDWDWTCNGTGADPVYILGSVGAQINGDGNSWNLLGQHCIVDGLTMRGTRPRVWFTSGFQFGTLKNSTFDNNNASFGGRLVNVIGNSTTRASHFVAYRNSFTNIGTIPKATSQDLAAFGITYYASYIWILDNDGVEINSDFVVIGDQLNNHPDPADPSVNVHYMWIAGNRSSLNGEQSIDVKSAYHVVMSQNVFEDMDVNQGISGANVTNIIASNNQESNHSGPVWMIFNTIKNFSTGDLVRDSGTYNDANLYAIGNVMHTGSDGFQIDWGGTSGNLTRTRFLYLINNTINNVGEGLQGRRLGSPQFHQVEMHGNIVTNTTQAIYFDAINNASVLNNLFWNSGSAAAFQGPFPPGWSTANQVMDQSPLFTNAGTNDYTIGAGSPAIAGVPEHAAYDLFETWYGIGIKFDHSGAARPLAGNYAIGAFEP